MDTKLFLWTDSKRRFRGEGCGGFSIQRPLALWTDKVARSSRGSWPERLDTGHGRSASRLVLWVKPVVLFHLWPVFICPAMNSRAWSPGTGLRWQRVPVIGKPPCGVLPEPQVLV